MAEKGFGGNVILAVLCKQCIPLRPLRLSVCEQEVDFWTKIGGKEVIKSREEDLKVAVDTDLTYIKIG